MRLSCRPVYQENEQLSAPAFFGQCPNLTAEARLSSVRERGCVRSTSRSALQSLGDGQILESDLRPQALKRPFSMLQCEVAFSHDIATQMLPGLFVIVGACM